MDEELQKPSRDRLTALDIPLKAALKAALDTWPKWSSKQPLVVKKLGGLSNQSFLLSDVNNRYVIRINRKSDDLGVDRQRERQILYLIRDEHYAPDILYWHSDFLVTRFVNRTKTVISLEQIGRLFSQIHQTPIEHVDTTKTISTQLTSLDAFQHMLSYYHSIRQPLKIQDRLYNLFNDQRRTFLSRPDCLCHHDLLDENIIATDNHLTVIDWEYAQPGNPLFDLAVYAATNQLSEANTQRLLAAHGQGIKSDELSAYRSLYTFIEILWWQLGSSQQQLTGPQINGLKQLLRQLTYPL